MKVTWHVMSTKKLGTVKRHEERGDDREDDLEEEEVIGVLHRVSRYDYITTRQSPL